jgi:hypothetical protein
MILKVHTCFFIDFSIFLRFLQWQSIFNIFFFLSSIFILTIKIWIFYKSKYRPMYLNKIKWIKILFHCFKIQKKKDKPRLIMLINVIEVYTTMWNKSRYWEQWDISNLHTSNLKFSKYLHILKMEPSKFAGESEEFLLSK